MGDKVRFNIIEEKKKIKITRCDYSLEFLKSNSILH